MARSAGSSARLGRGQADPRQHPVRPVRTASGEVRRFSGTTSAPISAGSARPWTDRNETRGDLAVMSMGRQRAVWNREEASISHVARPVSGLAARGVRGGRGSPVERVARRPEPATVTGGCPPDRGTARSGTGDPPRVASRCVTGSNTHPARARHQEPRPLPPATVRRHRARGRHRWGGMCGLAASSNRGFTGGRKPGGYHGKSNA